MKAILDELKKESSFFGEKYRQCYKIWENIFKENPGISVDELTEDLLSIQHQMERICDNIYLGKVVTAWSAFHFATDMKGYYPIEKMFLPAFKKSMVASEVKTHSKEAAKFFFGDDFVESI